MLHRPGVPSTASRLVARLHPRRLRRRLPAAVAAGALVAAGSALSPARAPAPESWPSVLVAATDLEPGGIVADGDLVPRRVPPALVPAGALTSVPAGTVVRSSIGRGEIVVSRRIAGTGLPGRLLDDQRGVTLAWPVARPPVAVGDTVDLVATTAAEPGAPATTRVLVTAAMVLAVGEAGVTVAVPAATVPDVHRAVATGVVDLSLTPLQGDVRQ